MGVGKMQHNELIGKLAVSNGVKGRIVDTAIMQHWWILENYDTKGWMNERYMNITMRPDAVLVAFKPLESECDTNTNVYFFGVGGVELLEDKEDLEEALFQVEISSDNAYGRIQGMLDLDQDEKSYYKSGLRRVTLIKEELQRMQNAMSVLEEQFRKMKG